MNCGVPGTITPSDRAPCKAAFLQLLDEAQVHERLRIRAFRLRVARRDLLQHGGRENSQGETSPNLIQQRFGSIGVSGNRGPEQFTNTSLVKELDGTGSLDKLAHEYKVK